MHAAYAAVRDASAGYVRVIVRVIVRVTVRVGVKVITHMYPPTLVAGCCGSIYGLFITHKVYL